MITGNQQIEIKEYLPIDRLGEGYGYVRPLDGQTFIGIPYGFVTDDSRPFIEVHQDNKVVGTLNCDAISEIIFKKGES